MSIKIPSSARWCCVKPSAKSLSTMSTYLRWNTSKIEIKLSLLVNWILNLSQSKMIDSWSRASISIRIATLIQRVGKIELEADRIFFWCWIGIEFFKTQDPSWIEGSVSSDPQAPANPNIILSFVFKQLLIGIDDAHHKCINVVYIYRTFKWSIQFSNSCCSKETVAPSGSFETAVSCHNRNPEEIERVLINKRFPLESKCWWASCEMIWLNWDSSGINASVHACKNIPSYFIMIEFLFIYKN